MGSKWAKVHLGNHCLKIGSGATPKGGSSVYSDNGSIWLIRSQNIYNDGFNPSGIVFISEDAADKLKNVIVQENDILLNITGDSVARVCIAKKEYLPARVNQHVAIIRPDPECFDARYLRYVLASPIVQQILLNLASAGATRNALTKSMIEDFEVSKPPLSIQIAIADHLESFDNKITLNRHINQTLEQMAQALFKSWFVDFDPVIDNALDVGNEIPEPLQARAELRPKVRASQDFQPLPADVRALFPAEFEESELGWVPKGWGVKPFKAVIDKYIDNRGKTPPLEIEGIPLIEVKHLLDAEAFPDLNTDKKVSKNTFETWFRNHVESKDILISTVGTIGRTSFVKDTTLAIAQNVLGLRFKTIAKPEYMFYTIKSESFQHEMDARLVTTVQASIKRKDLDTIDILLPTDQIQEAFSNKIGLLLESQYQRVKEIRVLTELRDTLLPKLISGELRLDDLPDEVVTAANE